MSSQITTAFVQQYNNNVQMLSWRYTSNRFLLVDLKFGKLLGTLFADNQQPSYII